MRTIRLLLAAGLLSLPLLHAQDAEVAPSAEATKENPFSSYLALMTDAALQRHLQTAQQLLKEKEYDKAFAILQIILEAREDCFIAAEGPPAWTGVRHQANRLIATLPREQRAAYELTYGDAARGLLLTARERRDLDGLTEVVRRYLHTPAGAEALDILGTHYLDRGQYELAADCFRRRLERQRGERVDALTLVKAFQAFHRAGDAPRSTAAWQRLSAQAPNGVRIGGRLVPLDDLAGPVPAPRELGEPKFPALEQAWRKVTAREAATRDWLKQARQEQDQRGRPALPGHRPVVCGDLLVYRSQQGVEAVELETGIFKWESTSRLSLDRLSREPTELQHLGNWVQGYLLNRPTVLVENSVLGALSADRQHIYAVEDVAVPPFMDGEPELGGFNGNLNGNLFLPPRSFGPTLDATLQHNRLLALDRAGGKIMWTLGGASMDDPLGNGFFLGPPLAWADKLFVLIDRKQEIRLLCLDPADGKLLWSQGLAMPSTAQSRIARDVRRRTQAAQLVVADGLLVIVSQAGAAFAVDPLSRELVWATAYRAEPGPLDHHMNNGRRRLPRLPLTQAINLDSHWPAAPPLIHQGRIILAAPDDPAIHCLDLHTGAALWKSKRVDSDLFLAGVYDERILLAGNGIARTLSLEDGRSEDAIDTGAPVGRGYAQDRYYHLPIEGHIVILDIATGKVMEKVPSTALGNLFPLGERVIAQDGAGIAVHVTNPERKRRDSQR